jgi:hypothetical protein
VILWLNARYSLECGPESLRITPIRPAVKKTLIIDGADFDVLNNPIAKSNLEPLPDIGLKNLCNLVPSH